MFDGKNLDTYTRKYRERRKRLDRKDRSSITSLKNKDYSKGFKTRGCEFQNRHRISVQEQFEKF